MSATHKLSLLRHRLAAARSRDDHAEVRSTLIRIENIMKLAFAADA